VMQQGGFTGAKKARENRDGKLASECGGIHAGER
jgi:hypothetical protein